MCGTALADSTLEREGADLRSGCERIVYGGCMWRMPREGPLTAGWARVSRSPHPASLISPGFGGPALAPLTGACRAAATLRMWGHGGETQVLLPAPRNQILLREASHACSSIWARGVKNAAAIKNPINFQPLVRAAGLSTVGGVLSVVNLSPLCRALICRSDRGSSGR